MIIFRKLITPDNTELVSYHTHDFKSYLDKNGKTYLLDGGINSEYYRSSCNGDEKFFEVDSEDPFEIVRKYLFRYNRFSKSYVSLCNISDKWLQNILDWFKENKITDNRYFWLFLEEKLYRSEQELYIDEPNNYYLD